MNKTDLHTHTTASDGMRDPSDLIEYAESNGLIAIAITDHDTIDGLAEARTRANSKAFRVITGVEFSIDYDRGSFHLLGLDIDNEYEPLKAELTRLAGHRATRASRMIDDLKSHDIEIELSEVEGLSNGGSIGRPHFARAMVNRGYASSIKEVFRDYLTKGKPGYVKKERISFEKAVRLVTEAGGISVIAHPISLEIHDPEEMKIFIKDCAEKGVSGIEAYAAMHSVTDAALFQAMADSLGLITTGGSDYHGDKDESIGYYQPDHPVPIEVYYKLEEFLAARKKQDCQTL
jgi:hypothetical protein